MNARPPISEAELHAFIDGELPPDRADIVGAAVEADPMLAERIAAFAADKAALAAAYRPVAAAPLPAAWIARIEQATAPTPGLATGRSPVTLSTTGTRRRLRARGFWITALAACLVMAIGAGALLRLGAPAADPILAQADAARQARLAPVTQLAGPALADAGARDAALTLAVGLKLHAPDLAKLGWHLAELDGYASSAALRYRADDGRALTLFVRRSSGTPRFDLLRNGALRTCIWQDEVVGAVMMGEMSAGQMMRVASAAYVALNL